MAYSTQRATSDGTLKVLGISIEFFDKVDIRVFINEVPQVVNVDYTWLTNTSIEFTNFVPNGQEVLLRRQTDMTEPRHIFSEGSPFIYETLDEDFRQILQIAQESIEGLTLGDLYNDLNMHGNLVTNLGAPVEDTDAANKGFVEDSIREILETGQGPINNAVNVVYIDGDGAVTQLQRGVMKQFASVESMQNRIGDRNGEQAAVLGYYSDTPGHGGGEFYWDALSTEATNAGYIFAVTGVPVGRWKRARSACVDVAEFGARRDADFSSAASAAAAWCLATGQKIVASGRYSMGLATLNLRRLAVDFSAAYISMVDGSQIILGNNSNSPEAPRQELGICRVPTPGNAQVTSSPTVRVIGSKLQTITVATTNWLQVWASVSSPQDASSAYSTYNLGDMARIDLVADPAYPTGIQWINENTFNIKRIYNAVVIKSDYYSHNHNIFNTGTFEEGAVISVERGDNNQFLCERFEGSAPIVVNMGVATWANVVEKTWHGNQNAAYDPVNRSVAVSDNGEGNMILTNADYKMKHSEVLTVNSRTCRSYGRAVSNTTSLRGVSVSAHGVDTFEITHSFQILADTGKMPVRVNDGFQAIMDGTKMRCRWMIYDTSGKEMTAIVNTSLARMDGGTAPTGGNVYSQGSGVPDSYFVVRGATIGYVRCQIYGNGATGLGQVFKHIGVVAITQHINKDGPQRTACMSHREPATAAKPVIGWAEPGDAVQSTTAAATRWLCTFSLATALSGTMAAASTAIATTSSTGLAAGDVVGIQLDSGAWHWTTLASAGALTAGVPTIASSANPVVFVRWI